MTLVRAGAQIALALAMVLGAIHAFRLALLPLLQTFFDLSLAGTSVVRRVGICCFALGGYIAYVRWMEKRGASELSLSPRKLLAIGLGAASGSLLIGVVLGMLFVVGAYQYISYRGFVGALLGTACLIGIAALLEEIVFRGIVFRLSEASLGRAPALWIQAVLFSVMHYANIDAGASKLAILTTLLTGIVLGLFWAQVFVLSRNLWVCSANHAAWNFTIILSGAPLSGIESWTNLAPIALRVQGPDWLHGGAFGPEDSIFAIGLMVLVVVLLQRRIAGKAAVLQSR